MGSGETEMKKWIPVTKSLPKCEGVKDPDLGWIVCNNKSSKNSVHITYQHPSWWNSEKGEKITHWFDMKLPEVPK